MSRNGRNGRPTKTDALTHRGDPQAAVGAVEWFRPFEYDRVEQTLSWLRALGIRRLRTGISWADWHVEGSAGWYDWLVPRLAEEVELLPCFLYTPPSLGLRRSTASPPRDPKAYADFLDVAISRWGEHFEWVELWNEPNNPSEWDRTLDPDWKLFAAMIGGAAHWARKRGKKTLLGGLSPIDPHWLGFIRDVGVLDQLDAVGVHGFPGTWESGWTGWADKLESVAAVLATSHPRLPVWITETGYSTWRHDEIEQARALLAALSVPVERVYWYGMLDLPAECETLDGFHVDEREYHFGLLRGMDEPKLLARIWKKEGLPGVRSLVEIATPRPGPRRARPASVLVTGGAGFIGSNLADRLLAQGRRVVVLDNLSRPGSEVNARWLRERHGDQVEFRIGDVRNRFAVREAIQGATEVYHFAAQVAVTKSLESPVDDFEVNARGTLNVLEEARALAEPPGILLASTNKVYGALADLALERTPAGWIPRDPRLRSRGVGESRPLDLHSPYGCSKGAADQYLLDFARSYGIPAVVFRTSCVYGPRQFGTEDQGWVAHFLARALEGMPVTIFGDGHQVRDVLFVDDLVEAFLQARARMGELSGAAYNIGGGPENAVSLLDMLELIGDLTGRPADLDWGEARVGDQLYYVTDTSRFQTLTGWRPRVGYREGTSRLHRWLLEERGFELPAPALVREAS